MNHAAIFAVSRQCDLTTSDMAALVGRMALSAIFILSGFSKVADPASTMGYIQSVGLPLPELAFLGAVVLEVFGGLALIAGLQTRMFAAALALFSLITALVFHGNIADQNQFIHFFKNIAMAGGLLQIVAFGGGRMSIDAYHR